MRTFVAGTTKIDIIAHIGGEDLELDRLVLSRFEGSETIANAAFQTLVDRYCGRPLAEYALAPQEIEIELRERGGLTPAEPQRPAGSGAHDA